MLTDEEFAAAKARLLT
ncbi:hypothetical protein [Arthrobacter sp. Helios]|nr:hypothetical protein [Arthrobacter sp. Helios]UPO78785.1 hypothetical protein ArtHe_05275 [Arthrobacter sp. Helios]